MLRVFTILVCALNVSIMILAQTSLSGLTAYSDLPPGKFWFKATTFTQVGTTNSGPPSNGVAEACGGLDIGSTYYAMYTCIPTVCGDYLTYAPTRAPTRSPLTGTPQNGQPSSQPTNQPSMQPTMQPSMQPSTQVSFKCRFLTI
jgi:hypothetical protein